jgi:hypothetical protein
LHVAGGVLAPRDRSSFPRLRRIAASKSLRITAIVAVAAALLYLVTANVALTSRAVAHLLSEDPETLHVEYTGARTLWPGRVHVESLRVRNRTSTVEWELHIDEADANISLLSLLRHRFAVGKVTANGVTFRLRLRLPPEDIDLDRVARMPPIAGFADVAQRGVPPDPSPGTGKPWTIDLQGVSAANVREVWIDAFRGAGALSVRGGFTVGADILTLAPSSAEIRGIDLTTGNDAIAREVTGSIDAVMDTLDLNAVHGAAVLRYLTTHSALQGEVAELTFLRHFIRSDKIVFSGGEGTFRGSTNVVRGIALPGTTAHIALERAKVVAQGSAVSGEVHVDFTAGNGRNAGEETTSEVELSDLSITLPGYEAAAVTCRSLSATAKSHRIDVAEPEISTRDFTYSWTAPHVSVVDLHAIDGALPKGSPFHIEHGSAALAMHGQGSLDGASMNAEIDSSASMRVWGARVESGIKGKVPLKASFAEGTLDFTGTELTLTDPTVSGWWAQVSVKQLMAHLRPAKVALSVAVTARDGAPFLAFYRNTKASSSVADVAMAIIPGPLAESMTSHLHGAVHLAAWAGGLDVKGLDVVGAGSRLRGVLKGRGEKLDGGLLVEAGPAAVGLSFAGGGTSAVLLGAKRWFEVNVAPPPPP